MNLDGHIHIHAELEGREALAARMAAAGVEGGALFSPRPACFGGAIGTAAPAARLETVLDWCAVAPNLYPLFWIDPLEVDAPAQVTMAVARGVAGFKVICDHYDPGHPRAMATFRAIAAAGKPILFHAGILWDGKPSSNHSRPANFEALLDVPGLRFALAHIAWPWVDECIAVYGKVESARRRRSDLDVELFIDTTPGTPPIYRQEALTKLFTVGYDVAHNVFFGSDNHAGTYDADYARDWIARDRAILEALEVPPPTLDGVFGGNLLRFLGI